MPTLPYAPPSAFAPRYSRLALGSALLAFSYMTLLAVPLLTALLTPSSSNILLWTAFASNLLANILFIAAAVAFTTFRRNPGHLHLFLWPGLATLHLFILLSLWLVNGITVSATPALSALMILASACNYLLYVVLIIAALVFLCRIRNLPLTLLAFPCLSLNCLVIAFSALVSLWLRHTFPPTNSWYLVLSGIVNVNNLLQFLFWLTLAILATLLAHKSRPRPI